MGKILAFCVFFWYNYIKWIYVKLRGENMATYNIPRNTKGEGRILFIFTPKSLGYTFAGIVIGFPFAKIFSLFGITIFKVVNLSIIAYPIFGFIGFAIGTFKIPEIPGWQFTKSTSGLKIDEVILKAIKFRKKGKRIYVYAKEEKGDE